MEPIALRKWLCAILLAAPGAAWTQAVEPAAAVSTDPLAPQPRSRVDEKANQPSNASNRGQQSMRTVRAQQRGEGGKKHAIDGAAGGGVRTNPYVPNPPDIGHYGDGARWGAGAGP
jgi:hypothetical protein